MHFVNLKAQYQAYKDEINEAIQGVLDRGDFILGQDEKKFEAEMADYLDIKHAIGCANGTDAILLSLLALDIGPGDEVIVPSFTFIASASQIILTGATPIFADIELDTMNIDPASIESKISDKTKAILVVHLFGRPANMTKIMKIAKKHDLKVIEDTAQSFGAIYNHGEITEKQAGTMGNCGTFSFFPAKNLGAYGDGGAVVCDSDEVYEKIKMLRFHGHEKKYHSKYIGYNSRLDTIQAAVLRVKLNHFPDEVEARRKRGEYYNQHLEADFILSKPKFSDRYQHSFNYYTLRIDEEYRDDLKQYLKKKDIPSMVYYPVPCHNQEAIEALKFKDDLKDLDNTHTLQSQVLSLPMCPFLKKEEQDEVIEAVNSFM